ncbi:hypothetical protein [Streptomyces mirabilis]|uniref:hypothetical protein n=1 Tax=Streptomyces mirabilis TaxID=68239 RepID=UPI0036C3B050
MSVQVDEELPVGEPLGEHVPGVYREGRLPHSGHPVDDVDQQGLSGLLRGTYRAHERLQLGRPVGERRGVSRQRPQHQGSPGRT